MVCSCCKGTLSPPNHNIRTCPAAHEGWGPVPVKKVRKPFENLGSCMKIFKEPTSFYTAPKARKTGNKFDLQGNSISTINLMGDNLEKVEVQQCVDITGPEPEPVSESESLELISLICETFEVYLKHGPRSSQKTKCLHNGLLKIIQKTLPHGFCTQIEQTVESVNSSGHKNCDIVAYKEELDSSGNIVRTPYIIFPVKYTMTNYYQNKNNYWETLTGEIFHLKKANPHVHIIPINIVFNEIPYCEKCGVISKFEKLTYDKTYKITEKLTEWGLTSDVINYIVDVDHLCQVGEKYDKCPTIIGFNVETPYRSFSEVLSPILQ